MAVRLPAGLRDDAVPVSRGQSEVGYSLVGAAPGTPTVEGATAVYSPKGPKHQPTWDPAEVERLSHDCSLD